MFIDVTRFGGMRVMRVAVAAIAYLDAVDGGTAIHLIGGETVRANEDPAEIEARCEPVAELLINPTADESQAALVAAGIIQAAPSAPVAPISEPAATPKAGMQHRQGRRR